MDHQNLKENTFQRIETELMTDQKEAHLLKDLQSETQKDRQNLKENTFQRIETKQKTGRKEIHLQKDLQREIRIQDHQTLKKILLQNHLIEKVQMIKKTGTPLSGHQGRQINLQLNLKKSRRIINLI